MGIKRDHSHRPQRVSRYRPVPGAQGPSNGSRQSFDELRMSGNPEDDERLVIPDLALFVNGIPLVVMEARSPSLLHVWKSQAVRRLRRYQQAGTEGAKSPGHVCSGDRG